MFLVLVLANYFFTWEGSLVGVSLGTLAGSMIDTRGVSLFGLSLGLPLGSPLESKNLGSELHGTLIGAPIGLWLGSNVIWGVVISCVPPSGDFITSKTNLVRYYQLLELITLLLSPTWLIYTSGGRCRDAELAYTVYTPFKWAYMRNNID